MIENNADGELTGYTSGKEIKLVRNPNWDADTDFRPAYLDSIDIQEGFTDTDSAAKKILAGDAYVNGDFGLDATSLKLAATQYPEQLTLTPSGGNRYVTLNTTMAAVRRHQRPQGGDRGLEPHRPAQHARWRARRPVATHIIPPGLPGFEEAGGLEGPDLDFLANPNGDAALAAEYMKKAGFDSGKCEGADCEVTMVGDDAPPGSNTAEVFKDQLEQLGFTGRLPEGRSLDDDHEVLRRSQERAADLLELRLAEGLPGSPVDAPEHVQRRRDRGVEQLELAAARRSGDQQGHRRRGLRRRAGRARSRRGARSTTW